MRRPGKPQTLDLLERARRVVTQEYPLGATWAVHHDHGAYPHFGDRGEGAQLWDVEGRRYIDWFLGGGAITLGHRHPAVTQALEDQLRRGINSSLPSALEVEVAERLCSLVPWAEMVGFGKNGTDATSLAVKIARAVRKRDVVLVSGYHGFADWSKAALTDCAGVPDALGGTAFEFDYNDLEGAQRLVDEHGSKIAAIFVEPIRYTDPAPDFLPGLRALASKIGAVLVFDEVLTGLRVARGGAAEAFGVQPDLWCVSKSLANGLPLSAVLGRRSLLRFVPSTHFGMTFHRDTISLAASRATLEVMRKEDVSAHLSMIGELLRTRFAESAQKFELDWSLDGHPSMLHLRLTGAGRLTTKGAEALFIERCQKQGIYFQLHRVLPSYAHEESHVEETAQAIEEAMSVVRHAMDEGLESYLDSPIDAAMQTGVTAQSSTAVEWKGDLAFPFDRAPASVKAAGLARVRDPDTARTSIRAENGTIVLRSEAAERGASVRCAVELREVVQPPVEVTAKYRLLDWNPGNAVASVLLIASSLDYSLWCCARHDSTSGHPAWSRSTFGNTHSQQICPYGVSDGRLSLRVAPGMMTAIHDHEESVVIGSSEVPEQPLRFSFQLEVRGASGALVAELLDLRITPTVSS